jgi:MarR family 2-MHQ and catechol resistance regulon transcriptional repressor
MKTANTKTLATPAPARLPKLPDPKTAAALKLWVVLARAFNAVSGRSQADILTHGLTPGEFAVLELLHHKGPTLLGEIQKRVLVSSGGITFLVDRLTKRGLVERRHCATDRRARYAALTAEGEKLLRKIFPGHARAMAKAVSGLNAADQKVATALLKKLGHSAAAQSD